MTATKGESIIKCKWNKNFQCSLAFILLPTQSSKFSVDANFRVEKALLKEGKFNFMFK